MVVKGFRLVPKQLRNNGELIINRGGQNASNFFVFIHLGKKRLCYWAPGEGLISRRFRDNRELLGELESIPHETIKPRNSYFLHLHGHWRSRHDDGLSKPRFVVRDLMLHHVDYDLSGYHNGIIEAELSQISVLEGLANISKGISSEVSLPLPHRGRILVNGPHIKVWIKDLEIARELEASFLCRRKHNSDYRAFSSSFDVERFLAWLESNRESIALGIPHPFYGFTALGKLRATGILHFKKMWDSIVSFVLKETDGVAALNSDCKDKAVVPSNDVVLKLLRKLTGVTVVKEEVADMRFAEMHTEEHGSFSYFEPDSHLNPEVNYCRDLSPLQYGINIIESERRLPVSDVVDMMKRRKVISRVFRNIHLPKMYRAMVNMQVVLFHAFLIAKEVI